MKRIDVTPTGHYENTREKVFIELAAESCAGRASSSFATFVAYLVHEKWDGRETTSSRLYWLSEGFDLMDNGRSFEYLFMARVVMTAANAKSAFFFDDLLFSIWWRVSDKFKAEIKAALPEYFAQLTRFKAESKIAMKERRILRKIGSGTL